MPEPTDDAYEQEIRALAPYPSDAPWKPDVVPFLLRLLDAEREAASWREAEALTRAESAEHDRAGLLRLLASCACWMPSVPVPMPQRQK